MEHQKIYPSFRYHQEHGDKIVKSHLEDQALGDGWHHSPADFGKEVVKGELSESRVKARRGRPKKEDQ